MVYHKLVQTMMQVTLATLYPCHTGPASNARQIPDDLRIQTLDLSCYVKFECVLESHLVACLIESFMHTKFRRFFSYICVCLKYDLVRSTSHPKFDLATVLTNDIKIMGSTFHVPEMLTWITEQSCSACRRSVIVPRPPTTTLSI